MDRSDDSIGLLPAFTCVMWASCAIVSMVGFLGPSLQLAAPTQPTDALAQPIDVTLVPVASDTAMLAPSVDEAPGQLDSQTTPADDSPAAPAAIAPTPPARFAIPFDAPLVRSALARPAPVKARTVARPAQVTGAISAIRQLTLGAGEGRQPAPEYPPDSAVAGQQGSVGLIFTVDAMGQVSHVSVETGSGWPSLNHAAINAVRDTWRFKPGVARTYRVTIQFQLAR